MRVAGADGCKAGWVVAWRDSARPDAVELEVGLEVSSQAVDLEVLDGFAPFQAPAAPPTLPGELATGGYGLYLIHELMDTIVFTRENDRNVVRCHKRLGAAE